MRVIQMLPTLLPGDAVGNNARAIDLMLRDAGYDTGLYAENIDRRIPANTVHGLPEMPKLDKKDVFLYHYAVAYRQDIRVFGGRLVLQYHNITPPEYYEGYDQDYVNACRAGLQQLQIYKSSPVLCWADSEYNRQDLMNAGYTCPIHTIPILVPFKDYEQPADSKVLEQYDDDYVNFLFVGRVVPNKAHEDIIRAFAWYQKHMNAKSRLFLVGNADLDAYVGRLKRYIAALDVKNVIFPGHISFSAILAYYKLADIFLCMSRHEGFCVPLLEAMFFQVPIIARDMTAVPYTLGQAGAVVSDNDPVKTALLADQIITNEKLRKSIIEKQNERLKDFSHDAIRQKILKDLQMLEG